MAIVTLPSALSAETGGPGPVEIDARNMRQLYEELDARWPGVGTRLREESAVAIDGEIIQEPLLEPLDRESEVHFLPPLAGG
jgi:molybdopterin converting factor small subunit